MEKENVCIGGSCEVTEPFGKDWTVCMMGWPKQRLVFWIRDLLKERNFSPEKKAVNGILSAFGTQFVALNSCESLSLLGGAISNHFIFKEKDISMLTRKTAEVEILCTTIREIVGSELVESKKEEIIREMNETLKRLAERKG